MIYKVTFYDISSKREEEIEADKEMTCKELAKAFLEKTGKPDQEPVGVIYHVGSAMASPEDIVPEGESLNVHRLLGGG